MMSNGIRFGHCFLFFLCLSVTDTTLFARRTGPYKTQSKKQVEATPATQPTNEQEEKTSSTKQEVQEQPQEVVRPATATDNPNDMVEVNFESIDLQNLLLWVSDVFAVKFLTDDTIQPPAAGGKSVSGNKITYKTQVPLTKKKAWDLFLIFLDLFGLYVSKTSTADVYRIKPIPVSNTPYGTPLPSYINIDWQELPDNETYIRYIYFVRNRTVADLNPIIDAMKSVTARTTVLVPFNAIMITDKAFNIRVLMNVIDQLDKISSPESMSVLKLKNADATEVVNLYKSLTQASGSDANNPVSRILGPRKRPMSVYFSGNVTLTPEPRTNTLIMLGDRNEIKKIEDFIITYVDVELNMPYSPLYVYDLQYADAKDVAAILSTVTKSTGSGAQYGGVREGQKQFQPMAFIPDPDSNRLVIKGEKEDYLKVVDIIKQLDVKQPQIAIEVLIVNVFATDDRELGVQIRNQNPQTINSNVNFQTSGFPLTGGVPASPVVQPRTLSNNTTNPDAGSIMANLVTLATGQTPGATLLTIGNAATGVWGIFKLLQSQVNTNLIANPFLVTTNKYSAQVSIGETRWVRTGEVKATSSASTFGNVSAVLQVKITPQINTLGMVNMQIDITIETFTEPTSPENANKEIKTIKTIADIGNKEVLAIGGLLKINEDEVFSKVPILGDIPLLGWLFKNKTKNRRKDNLLIFISPRIIEPKLEGGIDRYTNNKIAVVKEDMTVLRQGAEQRDPVHRWFFKDTPLNDTHFVDQYLDKKVHDILENLDVPDSLYCNPPESYIIATDNTSSTTQSNVILAQQQEIPSVKPVVSKQRRSLTEFLPTDEVVA